MNAFCFPSVSTNFPRLNGILGRTVGELLGALLDTTLYDGPELGILLGEVSGSSVGIKSCNIRPMKSVLSMPNNGSSIGHEPLHTTHGIQ